MATKYITVLIPILIISVFTIGVSAQGFGTSGVSSRELPKGLCVVEIEEVVADDPKCNSWYDENNHVTIGEYEGSLNTVNGDCQLETLELVITETGRKPAFATVDSLVVFAEPEDAVDLRPGEINLNGGRVAWNQRIDIQARAINGQITGVPQKTEFLDFNGIFTPLIIGDISGNNGNSVLSILTNDLVKANNFGVFFAGNIGFFAQEQGVNRFIIPSQGTAGEIRTRLVLVPSAEKSYDFHVLAAIESPVGNLCSMNLVPVRDRQLEDCARGIFGSCFSD